MVEMVQKGQSGSGAGREVMAGGGPVGAGLVSWGGIEGLRPSKRAERCWLWELRCAHDGLREDRMSLNFVRLSRGCIGWVLISRDG